MFVRARVRASVIVGVLTLMIQLYVQCRRLCSFPGNGAEIRGGWMAYEYMAARVYTGYIYVCPPWDMDPRYGFIAPRRFTAELLKSYGISLDDTTLLRFAGGGGGGVIMREDNMRRFRLGSHQTGQSFLRTFFF